MTDDARANVNPDSSAFGSEDSSSSTESETESVREEAETEPSEGEASDLHANDEPKEAQGESLSVDVLRSALQAVPTDLDVDTWTQIVAAVGNGASDRDTAESLLKKWSKEERTGEYTRILSETSGGGTTVGALFGIARRHGWERPAPTNENQPDGTSTDESFTLSDFEAILGSLDDDTPSREVERQALQLVEEVSSLPDEKIMEAKLLLEDAGARVRAVREWDSVVKRKKKQRQEKESETKQKERGPSGMKGGEVTAWIADRIRETDYFALDRGGALYYYDNGRYRSGGKDYLNRRMMNILDEEGSTSEFSKYRCDEVLHRITTGAPTLWESPPGDRICLKNGIYNLRTGELEPLSPEWLSTWQVPIAYNPNARGSAWRNLFESTMPADGGASLGFELVSQLIMPASGRRKACYLTGGPNTGKSTLIDNLQGAVVGRTNTTNFALQDLGGKNQRACLYGKAMNVCADLPAEPMKGVSVFKQITGGDRISAEHKYKDPFSFTPHCHLLFSGNGPIMAPGAGDAFWDRWLVFPFENDFSKGTEDHVPKDQLDARLRTPEELSALLNDVLPIIREGRGITETPSMKAALERMRRAGEEEKEEGEPNTKLPSYGGDGATGSDAEPDFG